MERANHGPRNKGGRIQKKGMPLPARKMLVQQANMKTELLNECVDLPMQLCVGGVEYSVEHSRQSHLDDATKQAVLDLTRDNVKQLYIDSGWGWKEDEKAAELGHKVAQFLVVRNTATHELAAFTHFRFDMDYGSHVLYCYELQVLDGLRSCGLGRWLMLLLHRLARCCCMEKVVLTVGRNNPRALRFYLQQLKYRVDETSPSTLKDPKSGSYLILSSCCKKNKDLEGPLQDKMAALASARQVDPAPDTHADTHADIHTDTCTDTCTDAHTDADTDEHTETTTPANTNGTTSDNITTERHDGVNTAIANLSII